MKMLWVFVFDEVDAQHFLKQNKIKWDYFYIDLKDNLIVFVRNEKEIAYYNFVRKVLNYCAEKKEAK